MKKKLLLTMSILIGLAISFNMVYAEPKKLPDTAYVYAVCNGDNTATVHVEGVAVEKMELYNYFNEDIQKGAVQKVDIHIGTGRWFNFTHSGGFFAGLDINMCKASGYPASFLGDNIDIDAGTGEGSRFIVTCPTVRVKAGK